MHAPLQRGTPPPRLAALDASIRAGRSPLRMAEAQRVPRWGAHALLSDERAHPLGWQRWTLPTGRAGYSFWRERSVPAPRARYPPSWGSEPSPGRGNSANEPHHKPHLPPTHPWVAGGKQEALRAQQSWHTTAHWEGEQIDCTQRRNSYAGADSPEWDSPHANRRKQRARNEEHP